MVLRNEFGNNFGSGKSGHYSIFFRFSPEYFKLTSVSNAISSTQYVPLSSVVFLIFDFSHKSSNRSCCHSQVFVLIEGCKF